MRVATCCHKCGETTASDVRLPDTALLMRTAIIEYLADNPMGIGGGTLTDKQIAALLDATLPK